MDRTRPGKLGPRPHDPSTRRARHARARRGRARPPTTSFFGSEISPSCENLQKRPPRKRGTRVASLTGSQRPARAAATYNSWCQRFERSPLRRLAERTRWRGATERSATLRLSERCAAPLASGAAGSARGPADQHGQSCRGMPPRRCSGSVSAVSVTPRPPIGATPMPL